MEMATVPHTFITVLAPALAGLLPLLLLVPPDSLHHPAVGRSPLEVMWERETAMDVMELSTPSQGRLLLPSPLPHLLQLQLHWRPLLRYSRPPLNRQPLSSPRHAGIMDAQARARPHAHTTASGRVSSLFEFMELYKWVLLCEVMRVSLPMSVPQELLFSLGLYNRKDGIWLQ